MEKNLKEHWETVYTTKTPQEVSWTQEKPAISLDYIASFQLDKSASIIDIGGIHQYKCLGYFCACH
jgi:hypothetical protein